MVDKPSWSANTMRHIVTSLAVHIRVGLPGSFSELAVFDARLYILAASMSLLSSAVFAVVPGLNFTWRMKLPVPCSKRAGSRSAAS
jgi:hypothetical protein